MAELIARLVAAALSLTLAAAPHVSLSFAGQAAGIFAAVSVFAWLLERKGFRSPIASLVVAVGDAFWMASLLSQAGQMDRFGAACAIPVLWSCIRHGSSPAMAGPLAAGSMLAAQNLFGVTGGVTWPALVNAGIVAVIGLLSHQGVRVVSVTKEVRVASPEPEPKGGLPDDYLELRESYRQLRDHASETDRRARRDRIAVQGFHAALEALDIAPASLARRLMELSGASGLTLYSISHHGDRMVVQAASGDVPEQLQTASFEAPSRLGEGQLRHRIDELIRTLKSPEAVLTSGSVILKCRGKVAGMACLFAKNPEALEEGRRRLEEATESLGLVLKVYNDRLEEGRRLKEAELLYTVSCTTSGSDTPQTLCQRVVREVAQILPVDHLSLVATNGRESLVMARKGPELPVFDWMSFGYGRGLDGWTSSGSPEVALHDAKSDPRLDSREAVKRRIGSLIMIPVQTAGTPEAILIAMSHRVHGLDAMHLETLRVIAAETGQALGRLTDDSRRSSEGLATPRELFSAVQEAGEGCLVYMEIPRHEELAEAFGKAALAHAVARFAQRIRARLPQGGLLCRRDEGDYVAFLRGIDERAAVSWANDAAATASMIGLTTPDGRSRIPLALKAKTALIDRTLTPQSHEKVTA